MTTATGHRLIVAAVGAYVLIVTALALVAVLTETV